MTKPYLKYQAVKWTDGIETIVEDNIAIEKALQISVNDTSFSVVMQTPGDEIELACGLLFSEDIISNQYIPEFSTTLSKDGFVEEIECSIPIHELGEGYKGSRSLLSVSSCGICGKQKIEDINLEGDKLLEVGIDEAQIFEMMSTLKLNQPIFNETGAVHASALFTSNYKLLIVKEDVGRHNALDKAIGYLLQKKQLKKAKILAFSGRLSFEIIFKAFRSKIPTILAVSAPTSLAIDYAKEFGISLYGFTRENRFTRYC